MNRILHVTQRLVRKAFASCGLELRRLPPPPQQLLARRRLWESLRIDLVLDVGANSGQFGQMLRRELLYQGRIHSFEPLSEAFSALRTTVEGDHLWTIERTALGDSEGETVIHVAANSYSSSLLPMTPALLRSAPQAAYVADERIPITRLDRCFEDLRQDADSIALKLDAQGGEAAILQGARNSLPNIRLIEMEMSLITLYEGESLFLDVCARMQEKGYDLVNVEPEFFDPQTGQTLQVNGIFVASRWLNVHLG